MSFFGPSVRNGLPIGLGSIAGFGAAPVSPPDPGPPWVVLDSSGNSYICTNDVLDSSGVSYSVISPVLASDGTSYNPI